MGDSCINTSCTDSPPKTSCTSISSKLIATSAYQNRPKSGVLHVTSTIDETVAWIKQMLELGKWQINHCQARQAEIRWILSLINFLISRRTFFSIFPSCRTFNILTHSIASLFSFMHHASTNCLLLRFYCHVLSPKKTYNTQYSLPPDVASESPHPRALRTRRFNSDLASKEGCLGLYGTKISKHKYLS